AQEPGLYRRIRRQVRSHPLISAAAAAVLMAAVTGGIVFKTLGKDDGSGKRLLESIVVRGEGALEKQDWLTLRGAADDLFRQDKAHPKIAFFEKALKDHRDLVEKTEREWSAELDRIRREPQIGRASCRERVENAVGAGALKRKKNSDTTMTMGLI